MIVITSLNENEKHLAPGDRFQLIVSDLTGSEVMINEEITEFKVVNFIASFRFALEDGTCPGFHLTGVFANRGELPKELEEAVHYQDLPPDKKERFLQSVGVALTNHSNEGDFQA